MGILSFHFLYLYLFCMLVTILYSNTRLYFSWDLNNFIMGSLFLVVKFLRMFPCFILHDVIISLMCSLNLRSALVTTPKSFTLSFISISFPDGVLYASTSISFTSPHVICSNFPSLYFMTFFSAQSYILFRSSCIAFISSSVFIKTPICNLTTSHHGQNPM